MRRSPTRRFAGPAVGWAAFAAAMLLALAIHASSAGSATVASSAIITGGPLSRVTVGQDLSCQVIRTDGTQASEQVYPDNGNAPGDCGTFLAIDPGPTGLLYGPDFAAHCSGCPSGAAPVLGSMQKYTYVSQSGLSGRIVTTAAAGTTRIQQTDAYTAGLDTYTSALHVLNSDTAAHDYRLWRALDCYLGGDGMGYGLHTDGILCSRDNATPPTGRAVRLATNTTGSHYFEGDYQDVWKTVDARSAFPDTCACAQRLDNGIGLSWDFHLAAGEAKDIYVQTTAFAAPANNKPPTAAITFDNSHVTCQDASVRFTGVYGDPDGTVTRIEWDLGDGTVSSEPSLQHSYQQSGVYEVTLTVTDDRGAVATAKASVSAVADLDCCPFMHPVPDLQVTEGEYFRFFAVVDDFEHDPLRITMTPTPKGAYVVATSGYVFWDTIVGDRGTYNVTFRVTDGASHDTPCTDTRHAVLTVFPRVGGTPLLDTDGDGLADIQDNCPAILNADQKDGNHDGVGDACEDATIAGRSPLPVNGNATIDDLDSDGIPDARDDCPGIADADQADLDHDGFGDLCDADEDGDGVIQTGPFGSIIDNCPTVPNPGQVDANNDGFGDACEASNTTTGATGTPRSPDDVDIPTTVLFVVLAFAVGGLAVWGVTRAVRKKYR